MNAIYIMLAVGFGYWIGNSKSPQIVYDESKCPVVLESKQAVETPQSNTLTKQVQSTTVEPINQSSPTPTPSTKNDTKQDDDSQPANPEAAKAEFLKESIHEISVYLMRFDSSDPVKILFKQEQLPWLEDLRAEIKKNNFNVTNELPLNQGGYVYQIEVGK